MIVVATNGCFDILHAGHIECLRYAKSFGEFLHVGINGDEAVECLKGPGRPVNCEHDRAMILSEIRCVDQVTVFPEETATNFLRSVRPDVYVKGGDYTLDTLNTEERDALEQMGTKIIFAPTLTLRSTSAILAKIHKL